VTAHSQSRPPQEITKAELIEKVRRARAALKKRASRRATGVAAYAPNIPETYVLLLAAASLGAVFSSCAPEFGLRSVVDRWQQIEPTVLLRRRRLPLRRPRDRPPRRGQEDPRRPAVTQARHRTRIPEQKRSKLP
jgi:acetoacetyl-CoA synthetase